MTPLRQRYLDDRRRNYSQRTLESYAAAGQEMVQKHLARLTYRVAMSNGRLIHPSEGR
jgi:hypothetical protein